MYSKLKIILLVIMTAVIFTACGKNNEATLTNGKEALGLATKENTDDSKAIADKNIAIVVSVNTEEKSVIIYDISTKKNVALSYTGGTSVLNRYGDDITMAQIESGEIVQADYKKGTQKLKKITEYKDSWEITGSTNINVDSDNSIIKLGKSNYKYDSDIKIFSNNFSIDMNELNKVDELTIRGIDKTILSIEVTKGHGYIKILNADYFVGGLIEVGPKNVSAISKDMVIVAREGDYTLSASKLGVGGSQSITVTRNEELVVDISGFQKQASQIGNIKFTITPENAVLYVDGNKVNYSDLVSLAYGSHTISVFCSGYKSFSDEITVDSIYMAKNVELKESETETEQAQEESTSADSNLISVKTPVGAEVYFDGAYKGVAPVSFTKETGSHTIILRKTGYENKSYTIYVTSDSQNAEFSFPELAVSETE